MLGWYPRRRVPGMIAAYRAAGRLTDADVISLSRLEPGDREHALRLRYPSPEARLTAERDLDVRTPANGGGEPVGDGCRWIVAAEV